MATEANLTSGNPRTLHDYKPYLMDMVIEEYNDERIQNIANIHDNLIIGKFLGILNSMDGVWDGVSLLWTPGAD